MTSLPIYNIAEATHNDTHGTLKCVVLSDDNYMRHVYIGINSELKLRDI